MGPNGGPPHLDTPNAPSRTMQELVRQRVGDTGRVTTDDPAFQPPSDPLQGFFTRDRLVYRDIPIVTMQNTWTVAQVRAALAGHIAGVFFGSGQLVDSIIADDRVTATLTSRMAGLFGRQVEFRPADDSREAKEICHIWSTKAWPSVLREGALKQVSGYQFLFGLWPGQILWDTTAPTTVPRLAPWHARYTYYDWGIRKLVALTQDGNKAIIGGDGKWLLHAPRGEYRGWMWGALRAVAEPWLLRHFALRDMARFSEVHGMPFRKASVPAASSEPDRDRFMQQLSNLGQETTLMVPVNVDGEKGYDLELIEATATAWEIFPGLADRCDLHITLAILMQNLTTEVTGGSFAATSSHMDIRQAGIEEDNESWKLTIREQIARPFCEINGADPTLAPHTWWNVQSQDDLNGRASRFYSFGQSLQILRQGGIKFTDEKELARFAKKSFDVDLPDFEITDPDAGTTSQDTPKPKVDK